MHNQHAKIVKLRTYDEIAAILTARDGEAMTPQHVAQCCQVAEAKIIQALTTELRIRDHFRSRTVDTFN